MTPLTPLVTTETPEQSGVSSFKEQLGGQTFPLNNGAHLSVSDTANIPGVAAGQPEGLLAIDALQNQVICVDAKDLAERLPQNSIDLIATDPTYGIGYKSHWKKTRSKAQRGMLSSFGEDKFYPDWLPGAANALKPGGAMYLFTRWDVAQQWKEAIEAAGLIVVQRIVWDKRHWGAGNLKYFGSQVEDILFCVKGDHKLRWNKRAGNLWSLTKLDTINNEGNFDNPTQKPQRLMKRIIELSSDPGDLVFDPFVGSGTTAAAALDSGRHYIAGDVSEYQCQIARERLAKIKGYTPPLFDMREV
jgi:DNA modification methylase